MKPKPLIDKLVTLEQEIAAERGEFTFLALFRREDSHYWDVVVAASWLEGDKGEAYRFMAEQLQSHLEIQEILTISRIVLIDEDNPYLEAVIQTKDGQEGVVEVRDEEFFGLPIQRGYIITAKRPNVAPAIEIP
ncbi:MAG TPA: hypothetical protein VF707_16655 [Ardenticatenaceae bacterium]